MSAWDWVAAVLIFWMIGLPAAWFVACEIAGRN